MAQTSAIMSFAPPQLDPVSPQNTNSIELSQLERNVQNHCQDLYAQQSLKDKFKFLPYWYTCFEEASKTGAPVLKSLSSDGQTQNRVTQEERFMAGEGLLVIPSAHTSSTPLEGLEGRWYDLNTHKEMLVHDETDEETGSYFVKGGNIIPTYDIRSFVKSTKDAKESSIHLHIALDNEHNAEGKMVFADEASSSKKVIQFREKTLEWRADVEGGDYLPNNRITKAIIMGLDSKIQKAYLLQGDHAKKQKIQVVKEEMGCVIVEFVALANKEWKIIFE